jgi:hypothetical protein
MGTGRSGELVHVSDEYFGFENGLDEVYDDALLDCPRCGGTGITIEGFNCEYCDGTGGIEV